LGNKPKKDPKINVKIRVRPELRKFALENNINISQIVDNRLQALYDAFSNQKKIK
jgi:hypothetical protein